MSDAITAQGGIKDVLGRSDLYKGLSVMPYGTVWRAAGTLIDVAKTVWPENWSSE